MAWSRILVLDILFGEELSIVICSLSDDILVIVSNLCNYVLVVCGQSLDIFFVILSHINCSGFGFLFHLILFLGGNAHGSLQLLVGHMLNLGKEQENDTGSYGDPAHNF